MKFSSDFDFLRISKKEYSKPFDDGAINKIRNSFDVTYKEYCFSYLIDIRKNLNSDALVNDIFNKQKPYSELSDIRAAIMKEVKEKEIFFDKAMAFHNVMTKKAPQNLLKISFSLESQRCFCLHEGDDRIRKYNHSHELHSALIDFLNLMRCRVILQRISGYFWVALRDERNGFQYIHFCFYVDGVFNEKLGAEIDNLWQKCTHGNGRLINFTFTRHSGNNNVTGPYQSHNELQKILNKKDMNPDKSFVIYDDLNGFDSFYKRECSAEIKAFRRYVSSLAKEMYLLRTPPVRISTELCQSDNPHNRKWKLGIEEEKLSRRKIRNYGFSRPK